MDFWKEYTPIFFLTDIPVWASGGRKEISEVRTPIITFLDHFFQDASTEIHADCNTCTSNKPSRPVSYSIPCVFHPQKVIAIEMLHCSQEKKKGILCC